MTPNLTLLRRKQPLIVGPPLCAGGEAQTYLSPNGKYVIKLHYEPDRDTAAKLRYLVDNPPKVWSNGFVRKAWAWPVDAIVDESGDVIGYVMERVKNAWPIAELFEPEVRQKRLPRLNTRHLAEVATNLFAVLAATRELGLVLGDCSPNNVLFDSQAGCVVIDIDSAQITTPDGVLRCKVATPEYLCPSLGRLENFASVLREPTHDVFSAAAIAYQVMSGGHHFCAGIAKPRKGEVPPPIARRVTIGAWPYTTRHDTQMPIKPLKGAPSFDAFNEPLTRLFRRAFDDGFRDPRLRPSAAEFRDELSDYAASLRRCSVNPRHYTNPELRSCSWCDVAKRTGVDPFPNSN